MNALELINQIINSLKEKEVNNQRLKQEVEIYQEHNLHAEEAREIISNEESIINYDFRSVFELLDLYHLSIENLEKIMDDIKNVLSVRKELNMTSEELPLDSRQQEILNLLLHNLEIIKDQTAMQIETINQNESQQQRIELLEQLKSVLEGTGRKKYYTEDMLKELFESLDINSLSAEDAKELLQLFYQTKNLNGRIRKDFATVDEIVSVFREFLPESKIPMIERICEEHYIQVFNLFDEDNTRNLLQFFKEEGLFAKFDMLAMFIVAVAGNYEYIKNDFYPFIMRNHPDHNQAFFKSDLAPLWTKILGHHRTTSLRRTSQRNGKQSSDEPLLNNNVPDIYGFEKNIELLKRNQLLFSDRYDFGDIESNLQLKMLQPCVLKNNIELCKLFQLDTINNIPISCVDKCDIENKLHLAIELGLLHPPRTEAFLEMDKDIIKNADFEKNCKKQNIYNQSIRNYFIRCLSKISFLTVNQFAYLAYRLNKDGYLDFYNNFFSDNKAGQANNDFVLKGFPQLLNGYQGADDFVAQNFVTEWYSEYIPTYDEYDAIISEYKEDEKKESEDDSIYVDPNILKDPLIRELEEKYSVYDKMNSMGTEIQEKNKYVYMFNNQIISRYKVLNNASILKNIYGYLDRDMLLSSIVRNSFLSHETFQEIRTMIMGRSQSL